jgi:hypothetical protein
MAPDVRVAADHHRDRARLVRVVLALPGVIRLPTPQSKLRVQGEGMNQDRMQTRETMLLGLERKRLPRVLNIHKAEHRPGAVYIGRPSKWGNPFVIGKHGTRADVIQRYREWICDQPKLMAALPELRGKDLMCFCAPLPCHGDVLLQLSNDE